ncbi:MAG: hypothetical protein JEY99_15240 [Spirochaetales bacterium]|nr:hypothetical protein [Spirochaetales bacterium]
MNKIYKNQSSLLMNVYPGVDLEGIDTCLLKYLKPDNSTGSFPLTIENETELKYHVEEGDLDQSGYWTFWVHLTFIDGRSVPGEPVDVFVYEEGTK